jgi:hypothetical protein
LRPALLQTAALLGRYEFVQMIVALLEGELGPEQGWFHSAQSRYSWTWLAERHKIGLDGAIPRKKFLGSGERFDLLDRNRDGQLTAADFDWSERSALVKQVDQLNGWFRRLDANSNGRISRQEWEAFFKRAAGDKGYLTPEDLQEALAPPRPASRQDGPSLPTLLRGLFQGEIGSSHEGPKVGEQAPDFTLNTHDGTRSVKLSEYRDRKPVVLIFGSFT